MRADSKVLSDTLNYRVNRGVLRGWLSHEDVEQNRYEVLSKPRERHIRGEMTFLLKYFMADDVKELKFNFCWRVHLCARLYFLLKTQTWQFPPCVHHLACLSLQAW